MPAPPRRSPPGRNRPAAGHRARAWAAGGRAPSERASDAAEPWERPPEAGLGTDQAACSAERVALLWAGLNNREGSARAAGTQPVPTRVWGWNPRWTPGVGKSGAFHRGRREVNSLGCPEDASLEGQTLNSGLNRKSPTEREFPAKGHSPCKGRNPPPRVRGGRSYKRQTGPRV